MIPGPVEFAPAVLQAMAIKTPSHISPDFIEVFGHSLERLRKAKSVISEWGIWVESAVATYWLRWEPPKGRFRPAATGLIWGRGWLLLRRC